VNRNLQHKENIYTRDLFSRFSRSFHSRHFTNFPVLCYLPGRQSAFIIKCVSSEYGDEIGILRPRKEVLGIVGMAKHCASYCLPFLPSPLASPPLYQPAQNTAYYIFNTIGGRLQGDRGENAGVEGNYAGVGVSIHEISFLNLIDRTIFLSLCAGRFYQCTVRL
jgi:hypothetical protein